VLLPTYRLLEKNNEAQKRNLRLQVPVIVPITPRLRLVEDDRDFVSLGEIYDKNRFSNGLDPDAPLLLYRERCGQTAKRVKGEVSQLLQEQQQVQLLQQMQPEVAEKRLYDMKLREAIQREKMAVFREICGDDESGGSSTSGGNTAAAVGAVVPKDMLRKYLTTTLGDPEALWCFQSNFATQLAISSLLYYMFQCPPHDRAPHKVVFHKTTARVFSLDLRMQLSPPPTSSPDGDIPIRMTRNMVTALSPFLIEGTFVTTMSVVANALFDKKEVLLPFIHLTLRDELVGWQASKQVSVLVGWLETVITITTTTTTTTTITVTITATTTTTIGPLSSLPSPLLAVSNPLPSPSPLLSLLTPSRAT